MHPLVHRSFKSFNLWAAVAVVCGLGLALAVPVQAQDSAATTAKTQETQAAAIPVPATTLLQAAQSSAKKQHKAVLVMFHASWCGWCKRLEAVMSRPEFKKMFEDNYTLVNLDVLEQKDKKVTLENPGGVEYMKELGGETSGLPYYAFLDAKGKKLADSNVMPTQNPNIGYPAAPEEIAAFMALIQKTAPHWSEADRTKLKDYLVQNAPKSNGAH
jgi:thiol:disulfide interchange protein